MRNQVRELESADDSELLASTREGNDSAFAELYRRHVGAARAAARSLNRSPTDAEDAVAEAFARVLSVMRRGGGPEVALRPYLMTVVRNVSYDRAGARSRESLPGESELMAAIDDHPTYQSADLDQFTESNLVSRAFDSLSDRWKQVLWQTDIEGRSPRDLAEEMELAPTAVAALAFRAREGLADAYLAAHVQHRPTALCNREPSELARYVRNRMRSKEQLTFGTHLAQCGRCMEAVEELRLVSRPLRILQWPAFIGTPVFVYGGKFIGVVRRVLTAQLLTTAGAAAVTVATVTVANQVPFVPFDGLRPKPYVEAQTAAAPIVANAATTIGGAPSNQHRSGSGRSSALASVADTLGLPASETVTGNAATGAAAATPPTTFIGPVLPADTTGTVTTATVTTAPAGATDPGATAQPATTDTADTTASVTSDGHGVEPTTDTSASDPSAVTSPDSSVPSVPDVAPPSIDPVGTPAVVAVVGGAETQSSQPAEAPTTTTTTTTVASITDTSAPALGAGTTAIDDATAPTTVPSDSI